MPNTKQYDHESLQQIGPGRLFAVVDPSAGNPVIFELGPCSDLALAITRETVNQEAVRKGVRHIVQQRTRAIAGKLTGKLLENVNPVVSKHLLGVGETQVLAPASVRIVEEGFKLYGTNKRVVAHPADIMAAAPPPDIDELVSAIFGTGSAITAGDNAYAVVAWYDAAETFGSFPDTVDDDWITFTFAAAPNTEYLGLDWDAPAGLTPHHYSVYVQEGVAVFNPANAAIKLLETTGTSAVIGTHATAYPPKTFGAAPAVLFSLKSWDGVTTYVLNTDYEFDLATGEINLKAGGAPLAGVSLKLYYGYTEPASVLTPIGLGKARPTYLKLVVLQLEEGEDGYEVGTEWTFYKVNAQSGDTNLGFPEDDYNQGLDFNWDVLYDLSEAAIGQKVDRNGIFAGFDLNY